MNLLIKNYLEDTIDELSEKAKQYYHDRHYYVGTNRIKDALINTLKRRSEYKRTLKEYKKQCDYLYLKRYEEMKEFYKKYPDMFMEKFFGCKLM